MALEMLFPNFDRLIRTPADVERLNEAILQLAVQGKLVSQDPNDEPASELLKRIQADQRRLVRDGKIRKSKSPGSVLDDEKYFASPRGWTWVRLGHVGEWGSGATPKRSEPKYYDNGAIPWLKTGELNDGYVRSAEEHVTQAALKETSLRLNKPGNVLIAMYGATIGKLGILEIEATTNQACCACTPFEGIYNLYLFHYLHSLRSYFRGIGSGGAQPNISKSKIVSTVFPLPPLAEQKRIVAKVDQLFAQTRALEEKLHRAQEQIVVINQAALHRLDNAESDTARQVAWGTVRDHFQLLYADPDNVQALRQTILQLAVQGKLVPQNPNDEPASELLKRIAEEKERLVEEKKIRKATVNSISLDERLNVPVELVCAVRGGIQKSKNRTPGKNPRRYLTVAHVQRDWIDTEDPRFFEVSDEELEKWRLLSGDILVVEGNGSAQHIGRCAIFNGEIADCVHQNHVIRVRSNRDFLNPEYLNLFFMSPVGRTEMIERSRTSSGLFNLSVGRIKTIAVPLRSLTEQKRIVAKVDELMARCDDLEGKLRQGEDAQANLTAATLFHGLNEM